MATNLIIVCGGGHAVDILDIVHNATEEFNVVGWVDDLDKWPETGTLRDYHSDRIGSLRYIARAMSQYPNLQYVVAINSSEERERLDLFVRETYFLEPANIIHKTAVISDARRGGNHGGLVMGPFSSIGPGVRLGTGVHLNTGASINQSSKIGKYTTLSPGARVCGDCTLGEKVQMGANATVINLINVGNNVTLGAGAVVVSDIPDDVTAVGVPARWPIKVEVLADVG